MKQPLNEQFTRMQKLAGVITENQINEESYRADKMLELLQIVLDDSKKMVADKTEDEGFIIMYLQNTIKGVIDIMKDSNKNQIKEINAKNISESIIDKIKSLFQRTPVETKLLNSLDLFDDNLLSPGEEKFNAVIEKAKKFGMDINKEQASNIIQKKLAIEIENLEK